MDRVVTSCKAPSLMCQKEVEERERERGCLCQVESSGRRPSFSVKSRDLEAKAHSNLVLYLFLGKGN